MIRTLLWSGLLLALWTTPTLAQAQAILGLPRTGDAPVLPAITVPSGRAPVLQPPQMSSDELPPVPLPRRLPELPPAPPLLPPPAPVHKQIEPLVPTWAPPATRAPTRLEIQPVQAQIPIQGVQGRPLPDMVLPAIAPPGTAVGATIAHPIPHATLSLKGTESQQPVGDATLNDTLPQPPASAEAVTFPAANGGPVDHKIEDLVERLAWRKGEWAIIPFGAIRADAVFASNPTVPRAFPMYLDRFGLANGAQFALSGQGTEVGLAFFGPDVGAFHTGGRILVDFEGDVLVLDRTGLYFKEGFAELWNESWRFAFGQMGTLISPVDPIMVNVLNAYSAGNLGGYRPQMRAEHYIHPADDAQWIFQAALSQPVVNDFIADPRVRGTDNGWPNLEGRVALALGVEDDGVRPFELGVSGLLGQTRAVTAFNETLPIVSNTWAFGLDLRLESRQVGLRGEFYVGRGLGTYSGAISQNLNPITGETIGSTGGWVQVWYRPTSCVLCSTGYGIDDPWECDLACFQRSRNQLYWVNLIWEVSRHFQCGVELSYRQTDYVNSGDRNNGMVYHFMSRLVY